MKKWYNPEEYSEAQMSKLIDDHNEKKKANLEFLTKPTEWPF